MILEIACFNLESCVIAQQAGASRIELCSNYELGGITPLKELIVEARNKISIDLFVMIRPRGGNFNYSENEFLQMQETILFCKEQNCDGVVFGILNKNNEVDIERCANLVSLAKPLKCTFHRAFDLCSDPEKALNEIRESGFSRILTSGGKGNANENLVQLKHLITLAENKITIIVGGGIRSENIFEIIEQTGAKEFHSAAIIDNTDVTDEKEIKKMISLISLHKKRPVGF
jgi:copper homeostasis protein